jgi:hypothetical protein
MRSFRIVGWPMIGAGGLILAFLAKLIDGPSLAYAPAPREAFEGAAS